MTEVSKRAKPLTVNPLKSSQPIGAALAFLGLRNTLPMLHGAQGCSAFGKVFLVRHFREPIPLQTTAMDQIATVMNADENVIAGLKTICEKSRPEVIGLPTTGLSETQGTDIRRLVREFRMRHPEHAATAIVPVNTPDFNGCFESGFALALDAIVETLVPDCAVIGRHVGRRHRQVNVLASSMLSPGDIEAIREWIELFGLRPVVLPDIGDSLDGHLIEKQHTPLTLSVSMPAASLVFAALFGYLMPALGLLFGALLGEWGFGGDLAAVLGAVLGLLAGLFGARLMARQPLSRHLHPEVSPSGCSHAFQPGDLA